MTANLLLQWRDVARGAKRPFPVADLTSIIHGYSPEQNDCSKMAIFHLRSHCRSDGHMLLSSDSYGISTTRRARGRAAASRGASCLLSLCFHIENSLQISKKNCEGRWNGCDKIGRGPSRITAAKAIVEAGIPVMGNVGLSPQFSSLVHLLHPRMIADTMRKEVVETAVSLQEAGWTKCCGNLPMICSTGLRDPHITNVEAPQEVKPDEHLITKTLINYKLQAAAAEKKRGKKKERKIGNNVCEYIDPRKQSLS